MRLEERRLGLRLNRLMAIFCGFPSSNTLKSLSLKFVMGFPALSTTTTSTNTSRVVTRRTVSLVGGTCGAFWPAITGGSIVHASANTHRKRIFFVLSTTSSVEPCQMNDDQERRDSSPNTGPQSTVNVNGDSKCEEKAFSATLIWPASCQGIGSWTKGSGFRRR